MYQVAQVAGQTTGISPTVVGAIIGGAALLIGHWNQRRILAAQQKHDRKEKDRAELRTACVELLAAASTLVSSRHWVELRDGPLARGRAKDNKEDVEAQLRYWEDVESFNEKLQAVTLLGSHALGKAADDMAGALNPLLRELSDYLALAPSEKFQAASDKYNEARATFLKLARQELGIG